MLVGDKSKPDERISLQLFDVHQQSRVRDTGQHKRQGASRYTPGATSLLRVSISEPGVIVQVSTAMTGYAVLFDGWPNEAMFGRHRDFTILTVPWYVSWGHSAKKPRLQILKDTGNGAIRLAIFCPPRRRHPESSQASFLLRREKHFIHYSARYTVAIKDDSGTLPSDTIDAWKGVSPNEANFLDLSVGGGETGQSNEVQIEFKEEAGKQMRPPCKYFCCTPASIWR